MHRRDLFQLAGATALASALQRAQALAGAGAAPDGDRARPDSFAYGSGHFGEWIIDEFGAPAYRYTCDQLRDPLATSPTDPIFRGPTDQWHQLGNDRLVATASNFGHIQVRQDEGGAKFLNDYIPTEGAFGGGLGFLSDGEQVISTYYSGTAPRFERVFGLGYYRKTVAAGGYVIDQTTFAPFGDDPVLLTKVTLRNEGHSAAQLRWTEYWGCRPYDFFEAHGDACTQTEQHYLRRIFAKRFRHDFAASNGGILERKTYLRPQDDYPEGPGGSRLRDIAPPATFLIPLGEGPTSLSTDERVFFAEGGVKAPRAARLALDGRLAATRERPALLMQRVLTLAPGESRTLYSLYGYLTEGQALAPLAAKYRPAPATVLPATVKAWTRDGLRLAVPGEPWIEREAIWSNYYLRSDATYNSFFEEHTLTQSGAYLYINGSGGGGGRDSPLHAMPLIFSNPTLVKEVIRFCLKEIRDDGSSISSDSGYGWQTGNLLDVPPSDVGLWLLWLSTEYVLATKDRAFLDESIPMYPLRGATVPRHRVSDLLRLRARFIQHDIGSGPHGLLRIRGGDWNDNLLLTHCPADRHAECQEVGESVMSAAMAAYVFERYALLLTFMGDDSARIAESRTFAQAQRRAVSEQWNGRWYRRAWLGPTAGWYGDEPSLWLEPQPWAVISGAAATDRARTLCATLTTLLRNPSPIGAMLANAASTESDPKDQGVAEEGGVWPAINCTLIWALSLVDRDAAWQEWKKNTLARHSEVYPALWCGILSGPDTYNSVLSRYPGQAMVSDLIRKPGEIIDHLYSRDFGMTDFPVMNMHPHTVTLFGLGKLLGADFTPDGVILTPAFPLDAYQFHSPLLGLERSATGYRGWYAPSGAAHLVTVRLRVADGERFTHVQINGRQQPLDRSADGVIAISGGAGAPAGLQWSLTV